MKIIRANRKDFEKYHTLRREYLEERLKKEKKSLKNVTDDKIKKEYLNLLKKDYYIFFIIEDKEILGYLSASIMTNAWQKGAYIEDVYVSKESRRKGYAERMIKHFIRFANKEGVKKFRLGVDITNKKAIRLYKKLGFITDQYEMILKTK